jgi:hypothetical protein
MTELSSNEIMIEVVSNLIGIMESKYRDSILPEDPSEQDEELLSTAKIYLIKLFKKEIIND